jgi:hypothetical protein
VHVSLHLRFDCSDYSPTTIRRMLEVLLRGVVALLPAVHILLAEETHHIVWVIRVGLKEEASMCELKRDKWLAWVTGELDCKMG